MGQLSCARFIRFSGVYSLCLLILLLSQWNNRREPQNRDYNRSPTSVGTFDVNGAAHVASRILAAILLASKNGEFDRVLLGSSLQKLDYQ